MLDIGLPLIIATMVSFLLYSQYYPNAQSHLPRYLNLLNLTILVGKQVDRQFCFAVKNPVSTIHSYWRIMTFASIMGDEFLFNKSAAN